MKTAHKKWIKKMTVRKMFEAFISRPEWRNYVGADNLTNFLKETIPLAEEIKGEGYVRLKTEAIIEAKILLSILQHECDGRFKKSKKLLHVDFSEYCRDN